MKIQNTISALFVFFLNIYCKNLLAYELRPLNKYANTEVLINPPNIYQLYWNYSDTDLTFEIMTRKSNGWIFFGFTSNNSLLDGIKKLKLFSIYIKYTLKFKVTSYFHGRTRMEVFRSNQDTIKTTILYLELASARGLILDHIP